MCTSFIFRSGSPIIGMNFDNNGMKFFLNTRTPDWFSVSVDAGNEKHPSFGVRRDGVFFNNLCVDSNGKGLYRRPAKGFTHSGKLLMDLIKGALQPEQFSDYFGGTTVVNSPCWSTHHMVCNQNGNTWAIEPGRGVLYSSTDASPFFIMTNFSLIDVQNGLTNITCERYLTAQRMLSDARCLDIAGAFQVLNAVKQDSGNWQTAFSMVYSAEEQTVYFCFNRNFSEVERYSFGTEN